MNKYSALLLSYLVFISFTTDCLSSNNKYILDHKVDLKNRIVLDNMKHSYYSSYNHCSVDYMPLKKKYISNYTNHSNNTNMTLNKAYIKYNRNN